MMKLDWSDIGAVSAVVFQGYTALAAQNEGYCEASVRDAEGKTVHTSSWDDIPEAKAACTEWLEKKDKPVWIQDEEWLHHTTWRGLRITITPTTFDDCYTALVWEGHVHRPVTAFRKEFRTVEGVKEAIEKWVRAL